MGLLIGKGGLFDKPDPLKRCEALGIFLEEVVNKFNADILSEASQEWLKIFLQVSKATEIIRM